MAEIKWDPSLELGVGLVDGQHRRLVELLNELSRAVEGGFAEDRTAGVLDQLIEYAIYHFNDEEALMRRVDHPEIARHQGEHQIFRDKLEDLTFRLDMEDADVSAEALAFLRDWFVNHVKGSDMRIKESLASGDE